MKKKWENPKIQVQEFMPNEYVAVCWRVGCENDTTISKQYSNALKAYGYHWNQPEGPYDSPFSHDGDCRIASNNYFRGSADGSDLEFVMETSSAQGNLGGGFDYWIDNGDKVVGTGDVIYWHTSNSERTWNHWGYVETAEASHPNRS